MYPKHLSLLNLLISSYSVRCELPVAATVRDTHLDSFGWLIAQIRVVSLFAVLPSSPSFAPADGGH